MKKNMKSRVRKRAFDYRLILLIVLFLLAFSTAGDGQGVQHKIEREIPFSSEGRIKINGPESVRVTGNGTIFTQKVGDQYIVSRKSNAPNIYVIDKKLILNTWDKQAIKQVSTITLSCKTTEQENELIKALTIGLTENTAGIVEIECELNIDKFQVENGWFTAENNHIILGNGKIYPINYLSISTKLYLPTNSQVDITTEETDIVFGQHEGSLRINATGGSFTAAGINRLEGSVKFVDINIEHLKNATLEMQSSNLQANVVNQLQLKSASSTIEVDYIEELDIHKSMNDQFHLESVNSASVRNSIFSNYSLGRCCESLEMTLKSGDVDIKALAHSLKHAIIKNTNAKIQIDIGRLEDYSLAVNSFNQSKFVLPDNLFLEKSEGQIKTYTFGLQPQKTKLQIDCIHCDVKIKQ